MKDFEQLCYRFKVSLTSDELKRILKLFGVGNLLVKSTGDLQGTMTIGEDVQLINYFKLSQQFNLHKDSYNYIQVNRTLGQMQTMMKLRNA